MDLIRALGNKLSKIELYKLIPTHISVEEEEEIIEKKHCIVNRKVLMKNHCIASFKLFMNLKRDFPFLTTVSNNSYFS